MILVDTCVLSRIIDGDFVPKGIFHVSAVSMAEGMRLAERSDVSEIARDVADLLDRLEDDKVVPFTEAEARLYAQLAPRVVSPKRSNDMMIAARAVRCGAKLVTSDAGMVRLQGSMPEGLRFSVQKID